MASQTFEDEFMDVQSSLVSLCLEAAERVGKSAEVQLVYLYASIEGGMSSFNVFFRLADGSLASLEDLVTDDDLYMQVCDCAYDDLGRLRQTCAEFGRPCPTEVRGRYDAETGGYRARYSYEAKVGRDDGTGRSPSEYFRAWLDEVASGNDDLAREGDGDSLGVREQADDPADDFGLVGVPAGDSGPVDDPVPIDDSAFGGFVVSNNVLAGVPARYAFREPSEVAALNGWTVYSDADDDAYVSDPGNFTVVTASTLARLSPAVVDVFDAPYGTDIALLYDDEGHFAGYWDNEGEREVTRAQVLGGEVRG